MTATPRQPTEAARIVRLRWWILFLSLVPAAVFAVLGWSRVAVGLASGGIIVLLNLLGTQRAVFQIVEGNSLERLVSMIVWFAKFGITAAVILSLLHAGAVQPLALLAGLGTLPVSLIFDIFLFPVNKG